MTTADLTRSLTMDAGAGSEWGDSVTESDLVRWLAQTNSHGA